MNTGCGGLDAGELRLVVIPGQMDPAGELSAGAAAALELLMGPLQPRRQDILIGELQKSLLLNRFVIHHH